MMQNFHIEGMLVQPSLNKVSFGDKEWKVEPKIMNVLVVLAQNKGKVVSKEELLEEVWQGTIVVDMVVTRAISQLRNIFKQGLNGTKVIETIPKKGYRIVANLSFDEKEGIVFTKQKPLLIITMALFVLTYFGYRYGDFGDELKTHQPTVTVRPFTSYSGWEYNPKISPDQKHVTFIWNDDSDESFKLCVKSFKDESNRVLIKSKNPLFSPIWSKNQNNIIYYKNENGLASIYSIPSFGGNETKLIDTRAMVGGLTLNADGTILAYVDNDSINNQSTIKTFNFKSKEIEKLTFADKNIWGDAEPRFSPSGKRLAYIRTVSEGNQDIYIVNDDKLEEKITSFESNILGFDWLDDENLIFSANLDKSTFSLWKTNILTKNFEKTQACINCRHPEVLNDKLVYEHWIQNVDLWISNVSKKNMEASPVITSSMYNMHPDLTQNMDSLVFVSNRSGKFELWTSNISGSILNRINDDEYISVGNPKWSPDNRLIIYEARKKGQSNSIYLLDPNGNSFELSEKKYDAMFPSWSNDGDYIYYTSDKDGEWQIRRASLDGLHPEIIITSNGGYYSQESGDGKSLFYTKANKSGIWQLDLKNKNEQKIVDFLGIADYSNWKAATKGIYYVRRGIKNSAEIVFYDFKDKSHKVIFKPKLEVPIMDNFFTIANDNATIIYGQAKGYHGDLMLIENL